MTEINPLEWEHRVRDDDSLSRETVLALMMLKTRYPNIRPGLEQFAKDCRVHKNSAIKYIKLARESGYVIRTHEGTHQGDPDVYELSYPELVGVSSTGHKNCDQSLVTKNVTRVVTKTVTSTSHKNCDPKNQLKNQEEYKRPSPDGSVARKQPDSPPLGLETDSGLGLDDRSPVPPVATRTRRDLYHCSGLFPDEYVWLYHAKPGHRLVERDSDEFKREVVRMQSIAA
jgi:hypothetical protein